MPFNIIDNQEIILNSSKSMIIRQMVLAFLYRRQILDIQPDDANDVKVVYDCLQNFNKTLQQSDKEYITIDVKDCGAAYRFLMAVGSITPGRWLITGTPRLLARPILPLVEALQSVGADITPVNNGWLLRGKPLLASQITINCTESSQFASALLLISRRIGLQSINIYPSPAPSAPYIRMTQLLLNSCIAGKSVNCEGDWSTAVLWYAFLALSTNVNHLLLRNLRIESVQGDCIIAQWMTQFGITSQQTRSGVLISKKAVPQKISDELHFDLSDHPDLAPVLAVLAALLPCRMRLTGLSTLNGKESRRLDVLADELAPFADIEAAGEAELSICGKAYVDVVHPPLLDASGDHRMVMAFSLISLKYNVLCTDSDCVKKSYPQFEKYFNSFQSFQK